MAADSGLTALIDAAELGHTEIVKMLIAAGAEMEMKDNLGWTALMKAALYGNGKIVQILLAAGARSESEK